MHVSMFHNHKGFTLVEILIVVILMGIVAAVAVPRFTSSTTEAQTNTLDTNLGALRSAIEVYAAQHNGRIPGEVRETDGLTAPLTPLDAAAAFVAQLTQYSDKSGKTSATKDAAYPYGPYFRKGVPSNPLPSSSNTVVADIVATGDISTSGAIGGTGWKVAIKTGQIIANNDQYDDR